jgi:antitoxin component HigA of HigAB toxin-antitoxin module
VQYRPIKSLAQYKSYESYLEKLLWIREQSSSEKESTESLITMIRKWDADHDTVSSVLPATPSEDPIERLVALMKTNKIRPSDLASAIHISQSVMSDILNYKMELSEDIISKLSEKFIVPPKTFHKTS